MRTTSTVWLGAVPLCLTFLALGSLVAERLKADEVGLPFVETYDHRRYEAHPQNWAIAQDSRGVMYFGNTNGVLEFDGVTWRTLPVSNRSIVRSLATDDRGDLYVGAVGELGRISTDESGDLVYESLVEKIPQEERDFADVWRTYATEDGVFFWTYARLFLFQGGRFRSWEIEAHWVPAMVDGRFYYNQKGVGLKSYVDGDFVLVPGGEALADLRVNLILPAEDGLLLGTRESGLYLLAEKAPEADGTPRLVPFKTEADEALASFKLYAALRLPDGGLALGTMRGGLIILDGGKIRRRFDRDRGLPDNSVWAIFLDRQGGLWLGMNQGLARLEIGSAFSVFSDISGIEGTVEAVARHEGILYSATGSGLFRLLDGRFERVPRIPGPCWSLLPSTPDGGPSSSLLVGTEDGVYEVLGERTRRVRQGKNAFQLYRLSRDPSTVFVGEAVGLSALRFENGAWNDAGRLSALSDEIRSIAEDRDGHLWLGTYLPGVIRVEAETAGAIEPAQIARYGSEHGLPKVGGIKIHNFADRLLFATMEGFFRFDFERQRFVRDEALTKTSEEEFSLLRLAPDDRGNLWISRRRNQGPAVARRRGDGGFELDETPFRGLPTGSWYALFPETQNIVWLGGTEGLYRYDARLDAPRNKTFATLIRRVSNGDGPAFYHGAPGARSAELVLAHRDRSLKFEYAAASFGNTSETSYRYRLEGYETDWSDWSRDTKKEYMNLSEGQYRFRVQGKSSCETLGSEASYALRILPPWYRTLAFRLSAAGLLLLFLWSLNRALIKRTQRTERELAERERALEREQLIEQLAEKNAELERFTYTVSHDLKAPLMTIRGFIGLLRRDIAEGNLERQAKDTEQIDHAAKKMGQLLNELLELSRIGRMTQPPEEVPFEEVIQEARTLLDAELRDRGVALTTADRFPTIVADRHRIVQVMQNLLQNAVKYMGDQAAPKIEIGTRQSGAETVFYVRDNGMGIDPRYHDKIFGLFERLDATSEGSGVGLALVKRIVEIHGGRTWVESAGAGKGATFCFTLANS